jgi:N-acylneuraminate cytidylyltransferase
MKKICIIPARGGSKRIPRKNVKMFLGKPVISYSIEAAKNSGLFDEIMVSTDDQEIAETAKQLGASVPFLRSSENSNDFATTIDVLKEVLAEYKKSGTEFTHVCCIYPVAPLIQTKHIIEGFELLIHTNCNAVIPVATFEYPVWRSFKKSENNLLSYQWPEYKRSRSQDLEELFHDAGQWYWSRSECMSTYNSLVTENTQGLEIPMIHVQDIDNEQDWMLAEFKYKFLNEI